ncbi:histidinol dehydrogenase [Alicyclobacillus vulcanalis]|uniref:Histidinol dehydrogenase n=1 Tax=Alicyclobacillus vulcanalis TaxID=252246 RepID=A0A1N7M1B0_9BACL|nr:histidinol dehydrogenase [Alicyclobacillus vulcanalis]SIS79890.1 histidinol dehydrogenase [Alicyclobacillus vulcanalis]
MRLDRVDVIEQDAFAWERATGGGADVWAKVARIVEEVRAGGDDALRRLTQALDGVDAPLRVPQEAMEAAFRGLAPELREALARAADRIRRFHEAQRPEDLLVQGEDGETLEMVWRPIHRVGVYAPGGRAAYPSTVLMDVIPAQVAGVRSIALVSPPGPNGLPHPAVLAAAHLVGVEEMYAVGGAQAIAALAYGTQTIRRVDKIVGPGNLYVATAKRMVMGDVGIDSIAGPTEVVVVADDSANPAYVAADMLAQAEHDVEAGAVCLSPSRALLERVHEEIVAQVARLPRAEIAREALQRHGALVHVRSLEHALDLVNDMAPEHVEIMTRDPRALLRHLSTAGAVFLGPYTPEPVGDYFAGTNHVLPTHGSARFSSGLGTIDFLRRMTVAAYSAETLARHAPYIEVLADAEALTAHREAVRIRREE